MYKFRLDVINMNNGCCHSIKISIDEIIMCSVDDTGDKFDEKIIYMHAMSKAYDIVESMKDYCFAKLVLISC